MIVTRFAPSPTGYLHIGGARTALFNYLFAKKHNGKFLLRIEDTDKQRSSKDKIEAILNSLNWLGLGFDDEIIYQSDNDILYREAVDELLKKGRAYYCFTSSDELEQMRQDANNNKQNFVFRSPWRDHAHDSLVITEKLQNKTPYVIRIKVPEDNNNKFVIVQDLVQGDVTVGYDHIEDFVLMRSDKTATYLLANAIDDISMGVTHIIRGDDHLNNAAKQQLIYQFLDKEIPKMAHIPLIHGGDGAKLSKRHGALGVEEYQKMGYLPEALFNYLLKLGWSHGDEEIISYENAIKWFSLEAINKAPARIDFDKMQHVNSIYLREMDNQKLFDLMTQYINKYNLDIKLDEESKRLILNAIDLLKPRAKLLTDMIEMSKIFIVDKKFDLSIEQKNILKEIDQNLMDEIIDRLNEIDQNNFTKENIQDRLKSLAKKHDMKIGALMKYIRILITGLDSSPSVFEIISIIGKKIAVKRLSYNI